MRNRNKKGNANKAQNIPSSDKISNDQLATIDGLQREGRKLMANASAPYSALLSVPLHFFIIAKLYEPLIAALTVGHESNMLRLRFKRIEETSDMTHDEYLRKVAYMDPLQHQQILQNMVTLIDSFLAYTGNTIVLPANPYQMKAVNLFPYLQKVHEDYLKVAGSLPSMIESVEPILSVKQFYKLVSTTTIVLGPALKCFVVDPLVARIYIKYHKNKKIDDAIAPTTTRIEADKIIYKLKKRNLELESTIANHSRIAKLLLLTLLPYISYKMFIEGEISSELFMVAFSLIMTIGLDLYKNKPTTVDKSEINKLLVKREQYLEKLIPEKFIHSIQSVTQATLSTSTIYLTAKQCEGVSSGTIASIIKKVLAKKGIVAFQKHGTLIISGNIPINLTFSRQIKNEIQTPYERLVQTKKFHSQLCEITKAIKINAYPMPENDDNGLRILKYYILIPDTYRTVANNDFFQTLFPKCEVLEEEHYKHLMITLIGFEPTSENQLKNAVKQLNENTLKNTEVWWDSSAETNEWTHAKKQEGKGKENTNDSAEKNNQKIAKPDPVRVIFPEDEGIPPFDSSDPNCEVRALSGNGFPQYKSFTFFTLTEADMPNPPTAFKTFSTMAWDSHIAPGRKGHNGWIFCSVAKEGFFGKYKSKGECGNARAASTRKVISIDPPGREVFVVNYYIQNHQ